MPKKNRLLIFGFGYTSKLMCHKLAKKNWEVFCTTRFSKKRKEIKSLNTTPIIFDDEHYLQFTPENNTTFYSSQDDFGINIADILWDYTGTYEVFDVLGFDDLKILTLNYDSGDTEEFELSVLNNEKIRLFHLVSETTYDFNGRGFIQFKNNQEKVQSGVRNNGRKRTKITRKVKARDR